ncbi:uncharacterized protein PV09_04090 [Verruconis gallopava]|uniref:Enoyl reductase (ER) domain-containing protein n=1 Tax=Verruconis gallopava TaxID=253628 RepID=A0A0D1XQL0_9PEZI|nr:uncharacterized protein PV09_04090 [Verruconis gallopava]KIW04921.1 hypothetical protein PV09_04090 [Verruconis gallopava]
MALKTERQAIVIRSVEGRPGEVYYPLEKKTYIETEPKDDELIVELSAVALNHRDLFIRQHLYPGTTFGVPLLSDGCGKVILTGKSPAAAAFLHKRVIINPGCGWEKATEGPEDQSGYKILGGTKLNPKGTFAETICVKWSDVEEAPKHLSDIEAAALPLTGLTAWRALFTKSGNAVANRNILVTGIGGGVALMVLAYSVAMGINVYVTSSDEQKLDKAKKLGARAGANYKTQGWEKELISQLPSERQYFDAIIDGAGGSIVHSAVKLLKQGGVIVSYGMTTGPSLSFSMSAVLKNIDLRGSTMGSREEFRQMVAFVNERRIYPVISRVVKGIDNMHEIEGLFEEMKKGAQFGKLVIHIRESDDESSRGSGKAEVRL